MAYRNYGPSNGFIVSKDGNGDFKTITAAVAAAPANTTIFVKPGTYTENFTISTTLNLTAWICDAFTPNVTISGTITVTSATTVSISGIRLQTNSAALLAVTGSAASIVNLVECYLNCTNNTGITYSSSSASSAINITNCQGDLGTTGIAIFSDSSPGNSTILNSNFTNSGSSLTANTKSGAGFIQFINCSFSNALTYSSSNQGSSIINSTFNNSPINTTCITTSGTGTLSIFNTVFTSGTASSISVGAGTTISPNLCSINSTNTNCITGAGTLNPVGLTFQGSSKTINVTTQTGGTLQGGLFQAPSAGFLGERISSGFVSAVSSSNGTPKNITSINITAGIWDVTGFGNGANTGAVLTAFVLGISPNTGAFLNNFGDDTAEYSATASSIAAISLSVPSYRVTLTTTTTYYLVGQNNFAAGTASFAGRLSAVRVG